MIRSRRGLKCEPERPILESMGTLRRWLESRFLVASLGGAALLLAGVAGATAVLQPSVVRGGSMWPALRDGERILVEALTPRLGSLARFEVVVLHPPGGDEERFVKRVVGLPGDVIEVGAGLLRVNGEVIATGIAGFPSPRAIVVPEDSYFVVGDNVNHSFDSRSFGCVGASRIVGRVVGLGR